MVQLGEPSAEHLGVGLGVLFDAFVNSAVKCFIQ
jgi:hypothetical protein